MIFWESWYQSKASHWHEGRHLTCVNAATERHHSFELNSYLKQTGVKKNVLHSEESLPHSSFHTKMPSHSDKITPFYNIHADFYSQAYACSSFWSCLLVFKDSSQQWPIAFITVNRKLTGYTVLMLDGNASDGRYSRWMCEISNMKPQPSGSLARLSWNIPLTVKSSGCQLELHQSHELSGAFMLLLIGLKHPYWAGEAFNLIQLSSWHFNHRAFNLSVT